jgi:ribosome-binding protein aMBF1 (putative translation factor)
MDMYRKRVAKNVRAFREKLALSQEALAERADMHWTFISGVERANTMFLSTAWFGLPRHWSASHTSF